RPAANAARIGVEKHRVGGRAADIDADDHRRTTGVKGRTLPAPCRGSCERRTERGVTRAKSIASPSLIGARALQVHAEHGHLLQAIRIVTHPLGGWDGARIDAVEALAFKESLGSVLGGPCTYV